MVPPGHTQRKFYKMTTWSLACEMKSNAMLKAKCAYLVAANETMKAENNAVKERNEALQAEIENLKALLQRRSPRQASSADEFVDTGCELLESSSPNVKMDETTAIEEDEDAPGSAAEHSTVREDHSVLAYKCAVCQKSVRGKRIGYRYNHIAVHENIRLPCVIAGCEVTSSLTMFVHHISLVHQKNPKTLSAEEKKHHEENCKKYNEEVAPHLAVYFPEGPFWVEKKKFRGIVDPTCKACGKGIAHPGDRVRHVATHIRETMRCPIEDCSAKITFVSEHVRRVHGRTIKSLTTSEQAKNRYDTAFSVWKANIDAAYRNYFS